MNGTATAHVAKSSVPRWFAMISRQTSSRLPDDCIDDCSGCPATQTSGWPAPKCIGAAAGAVANGDTPSPAAGGCGGCCAGVAGAHAHRAGGAELCSLALATCLACTAAICGCSMLTRARCSQRSLLWWSGAGAHPPHGRQRSCA